MALPAHSVITTCVRRIIENVLDRYRPPVVAFDTETTGLRGAVIQAAIVEMSARGEETDVFCAIVPPPSGYRLEPGAVAVHKITQQRIDAEGQSAVPFLRDVVTRLKRARLEGKRIVAHNGAFDVARLNETLFAHGMPERLDLDDVFCTMRHAKRHCGLLDRRGAPRFPKNAELYELLYTTPAISRMGELHDATVDARITAMSFLEGRRRRWWS